MSFWGFIGILLIFILIIFTLYFSKHVINKESDHQNRLKTIIKIRNRLAELDGIVQTLLQFDRNPDLLELFQVTMLDEVKRGLSISINNKDLKNDRNALDELERRIMNLKSNPQPPKIPQNEDDITQLKTDFNLAIKVIRSLALRRIIKDEQARQHTHRLAKNSVLLEVQAYLSQGSLAKTNGDTQIAESYFKHAKNLLNHSNLKTEENVAALTQISEMMADLHDKTTAK